MATGPSPYRRKVRSSGEPARREPECSSRSTTTNTDGVDSRNLGQSINQALQLPGGKKVKAFVLMALHDDGDISTHTTNHVQQCTDQLFTSEAEDVLRHAHRKSMLEAASEQHSQEHDLLFPSKLRGLHSHSERRGCDSNMITQNGAITNKPSASHPPTRHNSTNKEPSNADNVELADPTLFAERQFRNPSADGPRKVLQKLFVCERSKIERLLASKLRRMQQLAVKRIAKAWIKGICPKKQSIFPYHKKKREREGRDHASSDIPGWWPPVSECRFVEPDHIKRDERIKLCLYLLRLRPDPALLKEWNDGSVEPHQTHVTKGWTEFLMELAPPSIFDELREPDDKTEQRQKLLSQVYELAGREEAYERGDVDAQDEYWYESDNAEKIHNKKRIRRDSEFSNDGSDTESTATSTGLAKKAKKASNTTTPAKSPDVAQFRDTGADIHMQDCKPVICDGVANSTAPIRGAYAASSMQNTWEHYPFNEDSKDPNLLRSLHETNHAAQSGSNVPQPYALQSPWGERSSPASFSTSVGSGAQSVTDAFSVERPDCQYPQASLGQAQTHGILGCPVYTASQIPQPQIEGVQSNTPYAPVDLTNSPHNHSQAAAQLYYNPGAYQIQSSNAPSDPFAADANMQVRMTTEPSFRPCVTEQGNQTHYAVEPHNYYQQLEAGQMAMSYPDFRPGTEFQAPARVERGFTGHGSGVGGGAFT